MAYTKPQVIAQNASTGSYAAGCPTNTNSKSQGYGTPSPSVCAKCEVTA